MRIAAALVASALASPPAMAETKIRASFDSVAGLPFQAIVKASVIDAARSDASASFIVKEVYHDPAEHLRNVEDAIAAKADAMIVSVSDGETARKVAALADGAGLPLVFLNRRPTLDRVPDKISIVASNDLVAGRIQTRVVADRLGGRGVVGILRGLDGETAAAERRAGMQEVLAGNPGLVVTEEASAGSSRAEARRIVAGWFKVGRRFHAIISADDEMALGALEVVREMGLAGKVLVVGVDGIREAVEAVRSGDMLCTVFQNGSAQGRAAFANATRLGRGEYAQQFDWIPYDLVVAGNAERYLRR